MIAFDFPFRVALNGQIATAPDYAHIVRAQVIDAVMTNLGERVFRPRYGCDFQAALFDPSDELVRKDAASQVKQKLSQLVTRALVRSVTCELGDPGSVVFTIMYRPSLYATDTVLAIPVASEFIARNRLTLDQQLGALNA
jgi:phage baseplate assembly protein W